MLVRGQYRVHSCCAFGSELLCSNTQGSVAIDTINILKSWIVVMFFSIVYLAAFAPYGNVSVLQW